MSDHQEQSHPSLASVRKFWEENVCGEHYIGNEVPGTPQYFDRVTKERYRWHYHLPPFLDEVARHRGRVLEIGCGMGIDATELARRGVELTAIDLTEAGISLARKNFARLDLEADLLQGNAEELDFATSTFDAVYSFGVLHHTSSTEQAISEVHRVLKPGGTAYLMLYSKHSLNHWVHQALGKGYETSKDPEDDAPVSRCYSKRDLGRLLQSFSSVHLRKRYLFGAGYRPLAYLVPSQLNDLVGRVLGWHWLVVAVKSR
ncbi:MAG: class I SAM-dependent methyltransferase [Thermoanaerobaculia bacterium]|nr:class I SAM-dependent methyltransferase [Thermoanaerobaculia bacterium]